VYSFQVLKRVFWLDWSLTSEYIKEKEMSGLRKALSNSVALGSLLVTLGVAAALAVATAVGMSYDSMYWAPGLCAIGLWLFFVFKTSFYIQEADKMYYVLLLYNHYVGTFISSGFAEIKDEQGRSMDEDPYNGVESLFIFALWPLYNVVALPTTVIRVDFNLKNVFTKDDVPVIVNVNLVIRLSSNPRLFIHATNVLGKGSDLAEDVVVEVWSNGEVPHTSGEARPLWTYANPELARILISEWTAIIQEVTRTVAKLFPFYGRDDIKSFVPLLERRIKQRLSVFESPLQQAGVLRLIPTNNDGSIPDIKPEVGISVISVDVNTSVDLVSDELRADLNKPLQGEMEGQRLKRLADQSGIPASEIRGWESLDRVEDVTVVAAEDSLSAILGGLIGKGKGTAGATRRGSSGGGSPNP
jgi:hypothetical protein